MAIKFEILIADDDVKLVSKLQYILEVEGYGTAVVEDGRAALTLCREKVFDLAIVDFNLPDIPGVKLIQELAELSPRMEYIINTGHASLDSAIEAIGRSDIVAYIVEPLNMDHLLAIIEQVTERKQAEEELRESESRFRNIIQALPMGVHMYRLEPDGRLCFIGANPAADKILGVDNRQYIGKSINEAFPRVSETETPKRFREIAEKGGLWHNEEIIYEDGLIKGVFENYNFQTTPGNMVSLFQDITERRKMEEQLIVTDRLASIGELASGIAHELNNPLTSVIGFSDLLLAKDVPDDVKEDLRVINREAKRTAKVVRSLLTFGRRHETIKELVDINSIIQIVLALRAYEQKVNNIQVNTQFAPDLPEIMGDDFQLQQVFLNIVINAEHFMIEAHGRGTLAITTERVGDIIRVSFADDGPGIAKENLWHLFDPFFTTREVGKGTGLGLSICHGIITEHGGRIYAESELGKGASFIVELSLLTGDKGGIVK